MQLPTIFQRSPLLGSPAIVDQNLQLFVFAEKCAETGNIPDLNFLGPKLAGTLREARDSMVQGVPFFINGKPNEYQRRKKKDVGKRFIYFTGLLLSMLLLLLLSLSLSFCLRVR